MAIQVSDLQKLSKEPSSMVRAEIAEKIAAAFKGGEFGSNEKRIAMEIFRILVNDVEKRVRQVLSIQLSDSMEAPHDVILKLAQDVKDVSMPVLRHSYVLTESDLIDITQKSSDVDVMSEIAKRDIVSRELSTALIQKSNTKVVETLLQNKNASIDEAGLNNIYDKCSNNAPVLELMAKRDSIPITMAEKLFVAVSDEVKNILVKQYNISFQVAHDSARYARELATLGLIDERMHTMDTEELIEHLHKNGRLTFSIIIRSLCMGHMRFFEYAMSKLSNVPIVNVRIIVVDSGAAFEALYKKSGLPMEMYKAISYLLQAALEETALGRYQRSDFKQRLASRVLKDGSAKKIEYMDHIVMILQNNTADSGI